MKQYVSDRTTEYVEKIPVLRVLHTHTTVPDALPIQETFSEIRPLRINWEEKAVLTMEVRIKNFKGNRTYTERTSFAVEDLEKLIADAKMYWAKKAVKEMEEKK